MAKIVSESLIVGAPNAPLDKRTEVENLSKIGEIENPAPSLIIFDKETGKHYSIKSMANELIPGTNISHKVIKEVTPLGEVGYNEIGDLDLDGIIDESDVTYTELEDVPQIDFDSLS